MAPVALMDDLQNFHRRHRGDGLRTDGLGNPIVARQIIDHEYASLGVMIQTTNVAGGPNLGVAFDPGNPTGGDDDLGTPGTGGNAMNENFGVTHSDAFGAI